MTLLPPSIFRTRRSHQNLHAMQSCKPQFRELRLRERVWIEKSLCVNQNIPGRTPSEYSRSLQFKNRRCKYRKTEAYNIYEASDARKESRKKYNRSTKAHEYSHTHRPKVECKCPAYRAKQNQRRNTPAGKERRRANTRNDAARKANRKFLAQPDLQSHKRRFQLCMHQMIFPE